MSSSNISATTQPPEAWPPPIPISERPKLPDFPLGLLPDPLADWADALARNTETAVDLAATLSLAAVSAATAGKIVAQLGDGWRETLSLYLLVALPSGELKSPVFRAAIEPIVAYEKRLVVAAEETIAIQQTERDVLEMALRRAKSEAAAAHGASKELNLKVQECRRRLNAARVQATPQLLASDLTPQGLIRTLAEQDERLAIMTDEGELAETLRAPGGIDIFLKSFDGSAYRVNRAGAASIQLDQPSLVLAATVQPALAKQLTASTAFRERGLLGRMTFVIPPSRVGTRRWERMPVPDLVDAAYARTIRQLLEIDVDRDTKGKPVRHNLAFEREAGDELRRHRSDIERRMVWGDLVGIETFANKHAARVARLACLVRLAAVGLTGMVTLEDVRRAIGLGEYFISHAQAALQHLDLDPVAKLAKRIVDWLIRSGVEQTTKAEVNAALRPDTVADLDAPFELLLRHHFIRARALPKRGGPRTQARRDLRLKPGPPPGRAMNSRNSRNPWPGPVALLVTAHLGEQELGRRRAAGWAAPKAPQRVVRGGRLLFFTDPGSPFDFHPRWLTRGLRIMHSTTLPAGGFMSLPLPPIWLYRLALPEGDGLLANMAAACLDELELEAIRAGTMPRYLRP